MIRPLALPIAHIGTRTRYPCKGACHGVRVVAHLRGAAALMYASRAGLLSTVAAVRVYLKDSRLTIHGPRWASTTRTRCGCGPDRRRVAQDVAVDIRHMRHGPVPRARAGERRGEPGFDAHVGHVGRGRFSTLSTFRCASGSRRWSEPRARAPGLGPRCGARAPEPIFAHKRKE